MYKRYVVTLQKGSAVSLSSIFATRHSEKDTGNKKRESLNSSSEADASQRYGSLSWKLMIHDRLCIRRVRLLSQKRENQTEKKKGADTSEKKEKPGLHDPSRSG